jgi:hypothetical protein
MDDCKDAMQTVQRLFSNNQQASEDHTDRRWRWRNGTILFPEGRCCYCGEIVRSEDRLWVVEGDWLRGQFNIAADKADWETPNHPHAGTDGGLCLGNSDDPESALFFGVNPSDPLRRDISIPEWYEQMFGHKCGKGGVGSSELFARGVGYDEDDEDEDDDEHCENCCRCCAVDCCSDNMTVCDCGCAECYCKPSACPECADDLGEGSAMVVVDGGSWGWRCQTCWSRTHARCARCQDTFINSQIEEFEGQKYCRHCANYLRLTRPTVTAAAVVTPASPVPAVVVEIIDDIDF